VGVPFTYKGPTLLFGKCGGRDLSKDDARGQKSYHVTLLRKTEELDEGKEETGGTERGYKGEKRSGTERSLEAWYDGGVAKSAKGCAFPTRKTLVMHRVEKERPHLQPSLSRCTHHIFPLVKYNEKKAHLYSIYQLQRHEESYSTKGGVLK